ncbi:MAG TPA: nuclear transport factor 2 family protein [Myxococcota bacterium]|nr:nuclear transport factor 2 family protein [Myxococcales bacterium]HPG28752.1 nuclear transport factor 2 family protein [Myxococcota bacterium]
MSPDDLVAIESIRQLKGRYFQLMDQKRWDEWAMVFCEDCTIDSTQDAAPLLHGRQAFLDFLPPLLEGVKTVHHGHTPVIEILGPDRARATWSMEDMLWFPPGGDRHHLWGVGFYFEQYRRDPDGEWRILEMKLRRVRVEVDGVEVFAPDTPPRPDDD